MKKKYTVISDGVVVSVTIYRSIKQALKTALNFRNKTGNPNVKISDQDQDLLTAYDWFRTVEGIDQKHAIKYACETQSFPLNE